MMEKELTAIYRIGKGENVRHMTRDNYSTKTAFTKELRLNGFRVLAVLDATQVNSIKNKSYHECHEVYEEYVHEVI